MMQGEGGVTWRNEEEVLKTVRKDGFKFGFDEVLASLVGLGLGILSSIGNRSFDVLIVETLRQSNCH
jgi:hypothetical protein